MHSIDKRIAPDEEEEVTEKARKEFLEAARQYLFGMLARKPAAICM